MSKKLAIIGDYKHSFTPHQSTNNSIVHVLNRTNLDLSYEWIPTSSVIDRFDHIINEFDGYWISAGSPYSSLAGAMKIIEYARTHKIPTLGTCGGFQHMLLEYARNVLKIPKAHHEQYQTAEDATHVLHLLECSLAGKILDIEICDKGSIVYQILKKDSIREQFYCRFGLNKMFQETFHLSGFDITGADKSGDMRIMELNDHPFYMGTLFVPQDNSTFANPHPLIEAFIKTICGMISYKRIVEEPAVTEE